MRYLLSLLITLAWALWFGGTISTFVFGLNLFHTFASQPAIAGQAASGMFLVFGKYELVLAAIALAACALTVVNTPSPRVILLFGALILAGGMAVIFAMGMAPQMDMLRLQGKSHSPEFIHLHGRSMILMSIQSIILLTAGALLLHAVKEAPQRKRI